MEPSTRPPEAVAAAAVDGAASAAASPDVDRQKERLEKEIRAMNEQFVHLKALLESEKKDRIEQERARAEAEKELKELRSAFEGTVWTRVGLEEEVLNMEKETFFLNKMLGELSSSTNGSGELEDKVQMLESQTVSKTEEREFLTRVLKRLQSQTRVMRSTLDKHIEGKNAQYTELEKKRNELRRKLRARGDVERVIMELEDQVDDLKRQIGEETKAREQQEWLFDVEINDINKRLALEIVAREKINVLIEQAETQRKKIAQEIEALKTRQAQMSSPLRESKDSPGRSEFRKSFHPAAFHRTQSNLTAEEKKEEEPTPTSLSSSFVPVTSNPNINISGEIAFGRGTTSLADLARTGFAARKSDGTSGGTSPRASDAECGDLPFARQVQDLRSKVDEVCEALSEEVQKNASLDRELKEAKRALETEREERQKLAQQMAKERGKREELERKFELLLQQMKPSQ